MILPDVNLLVHAYNTQFPQHENAKIWWEDKLGGTTGVALAWVTVLGFIRVITHPRILRNPFTFRKLSLSSKNGSLFRTLCWCNRLPSTSRSCNPFS